ncbi:hypothetical protein CHS0354_003202 [Potamilus streckersoni]|uniref:hydroxyacylglutathione hydrolase n=1 Tax=Potamilus streckersoni TaxID=2493646 RepID=A0AAE0SIY6_9BIVA|nr:hypothetical protein CHS0354_003202 [Potamilus streckersoni]
MIRRRTLTRLAVLRSVFKKAFRISSVPTGINISSFHSLPVTFQLPEMKIRLIPALQDNYMYLLIDEETRQCAAVDPVEPKKILDAVKEEHVNLTTVLTTHHHWDHAGGNVELVKLFNGGKLEVYGGDDRIGALTRIVTHGETLQVGKLSIQCLFTPCHTLGHMCYFIQDEGSEQPAVFTGDTLFIGGCGRFFEGKPEQMYTALVEILGKLPANTRVFCGHEYTVANLKFAAHVEPNNIAVKQKASWAQSQRDNGLPTIPSLISEELEFNPFMRVGDPAVQSYAKSRDPIKVMGFLREEKNSFS